MYPSLQTRLLSKFYALPQVLKPKNPPHQVTWLVNIDWSPCSRRVIDVHTTPDSRTINDSRAIGIAPFQSRMGWLNLRRKLMEWKTLTSCVRMTRRRAKQTRWTQ